MVCIHCGGKFIIKDLELFIEKMSEASETLKEILDIDDEHKLSVMLAKNNIINIEEILKERGHIRMACIPCHLKNSWRHYENSWPL